MRCHQVRRRIINTEGHPDECLRDDKVRRHIEKCRRCGLFLQAESLLRHDLRAAAGDDPVETISFAELKANVERLAVRPVKRNYREKKIMKILTYPIFKKPRLGIALAAICVIMAFLTLMPFRFSNTVGYEVAVAAAHDNLTIDEAKVDELLKTLGIDNATFSLGDCNPNCKVVISDLKSETDVDILLTALDEMQDCRVVYVKPIIDKDHITIMDEARHRITIRDESPNDKEQIHTIVIDRLNELSSDAGGSFSIVMNVKENDDESRIDIDFKGEVMNSSNSAGASFLSLLDQFKGISSLSIRETKDGKAIMELTTSDGVRHVVDLNDPESIKQLVELGISIYDDGNMNNGDDSGENDSGQPGGDNNPESMKSESVPAQFELYQNAPNPFNPSTDIRYFLPEPGHVSLEIFNMNGQKVRTLVDAYNDAGEHIVTWDARNDSGNKVSSGVYLYRLESGSNVISKKMTLLK